MLAIDHLERIVEGRLKLTRLLRHRPSIILYKKMKLMNPKFYKTKGDKLTKMLLNIAKYAPYKKFMDNMKLYTRVNKLRNIQPKVHEIISAYLLKKYLEKWKDNVNNMKEQKIKLLLTYVKKKIKDEGIITQRRKNELLKRFLTNIMKNKMNNKLLAFRVWNKITKMLRDEKKQLIRETEGGIITNIKGKSKIIEGKDIKEGQGINITILKNKDGAFTIEDIVNTTLTEKERQDIIQKKMPVAFDLIDDKIKSMLKTKLYQWKSNAIKIKCNEAATKIQRSVRKILGNYFLKKRVDFFSNLAKNYLKKLLFKMAIINIIITTSRKIL